MSVESGLHMVWIILLLIRGRLDVWSVPIFSDCGNLLAASHILSRQHGIILSIKFCLEHLIQNVVSRFSISKLDTGLVRAIMGAMACNQALPLISLQLPLIV